MYTFLIYLFLIFQSQSLVSTNNVLDWIEAGEGDQLTFPWYRKTTQLEPPRTIQIKLSSGEIYLVVCKRYEKEEPKAEVFTSEHIMMDSLILKDIGIETCAPSNIKLYISPQGPKRSKTTFIYLLSGRKCVERTYSVKQKSLMGEVVRSSWNYANCPDEVSQFLKSNSEWQGGIVNLADLGKGQDLDYVNPSYRIVEGKPTVLRFPTQDPEGKFFKFVCEEYQLKSYDPKIKEQMSNFYTGTLVHQDNYAVILDRFKMTSCNIDNINVNRQIIKDKNSFKAVFKTTKGRCYEREYKSATVSVKHYFVKTTITRSKLKWVTCPISFEGDINLKAYQPWYSWLFNKVFNRKIKPFSIKA